MLPSANLDTFQQQLDSLQKSYSQLGKTPGIPQIGVEKHEILRVPGKGSERREQRRSERLPSERHGQVDCQPRCHHHLI